MHKSFRLTPEDNVRRRRFRKRPLMIHILLSIIGVMAIVAVFAFLYVETNNLDIFPDEKRYLGAALCIIACANAYVVTYYLLKWVVRITGLLPPSDLDLLTPVIDHTRSDWYEEIPAPPFPHPIDDVSLEFDRLSAEPASIRIVKGEIP